MFHSSKQSTRPIRTSMDRRQRSGVNAVALVAAILGILMVVVMAVFYAVIAENETNMNDSDTQSTNKDLSVSQNLRQDVPSVLHKLRLEFQNRYGEPADQILEKGIYSFGSTEESARRMVRAAAHNRPFVMSFAGYSVTVGRGNFYSQSFPFVVERILREPLLQVLGISLIVRNGAIGGIPSFPQAWCLSHFLGDDADVVSWDYSMNEGRQGSVLESYIRNALLLPKKPMFIMLDTNKQRVDVLEHYSKSGLLPDAIRVARANDVLDFDPSSLQNPPVGFENWNEFGAPDGCPGRSSWHPKQKEHELIGWMIAMHMVDAIELAAKMVKEPGWQTKYGQDDTSQVSFPAPLNSPPSNEEEVTRLLYGHNYDDSKNDYKMKNVSCRTSFLPAVDHTKVLPSVIVSGLATTDLDTMQDRPDDLYTQGWVLDVSKVERDTKKKVEKCGGLGYIDMKVALYGIPESGTLRLWLPSSATTTKKTSHNARDYFDSLVICEANESREKEACQLTEDIQFVVGGEQVSSTDISQIAGAGEYLKRKTCIHVRIPNAAKVTPLASVTTISGERLTADDKIRLGGPVDASDDAVGLIVDVTANARVSRQQGACCLSHIIWEQS